MVTRSGYPGVFISEPESETLWMNDKVEGWMESVEVFAGLAHRHQKKAYSGLQKSLQQDWDFIQISTLDIGEVLHPVKEDLQNYLLPALFQGATAKSLTKGASCLSVNQAGLEIPNPTLSNLESWTGPCVVTGHLVSDLWVRKEFKT